MNEKLSTPLLLDGATGTNLMAAGMPSGVCVEKWVLENPNAIKELQSRFVEAGSDVVYAPTFSANAAKLGHFGLAGQVAELNARLVALSKEAVGGRALVAGDMSPTGLILEPFGDAAFDDVLAIYSEQAEALKAAGVDLIVCETMLSLAETRAALLAARRTGLPVLVTVTVDANGRTLFGSDALSCLVVLQAMGAAAVGLNCSGGPQPMLPVLERLIPYACVPVIAKPNAGLPHPDDPTKFDLTPEDMANALKKALDMGVSIIGGCCGSTPEHISALRSLLDGCDFAARPERAAKSDRIAANDREIFPLGGYIECSEPVLVTDDLADDLMDAAEDEPDAVAVRLDSPDEARELAMNAHMCTLPLSILSDSPEALETALRLITGRCVIDSRCSVPFETVRRLAAEYGALLP